MPLIRLRPSTSYALHSIAATRRIEQTAAAQLATHTLMQRAGLAVARLACALAPHAQTIWLACGPGNNGGDGLEAAMHLKLWGRNPVVTWLGDETSCPPDALLSLRRARQAGSRGGGRREGAAAQNVVDIAGVLLVVADEAHSRVVRDRLVHKELGLSSRAAMIDLVKLEIVPRFEARR